MKMQVVDKNGVMMATRTGLENVRQVSVRILCAIVDLNINELQKVPYPQVRIKPRSVDKKTDKFCGSGYQSRNQNPAPTISTPCADSS
jgi:hypothetical protein